MTYRPKLPPLDPCPVEHVVQLIGGKWKARLLERIREQPATVGDLQRFLPRIAPQVMLRQLGALERDGIIERLASTTKREWGRYRLTERGQGLLVAVDVIASWGADDLG